MENGIVILGWGSLIYELRDLQESVKSNWHDGGPVLPIEFSRISSSRDNALTLVIDPINGVDIPTKYIISKRSDPKDVIYDLRNREGTVNRHIGIIDLIKGEEYSKFPGVIESIRKWCKDYGFRAVVWTDLPSNFEEKSFNNEQFSIETALNHLNSLTKSGNAKAKEYFKNAPDFVITPLRKRLVSLNWY